jgi:hypothetical protein
MKWIFLAQISAACLALCFGGIFMVSTPFAATLESFGEALPEKVMAWTKSGDDQIYDDRTIFGYIDGAAEVYRAYGMKGCFSRRYTDPDGSAIILDIFEMASSQDAFGVFTHDLDGDPLDLGQGGLSRAGWHRFWKDRFFVSMTTDQESETGDQAARELGKAVASHIGVDGPRPVILDDLPSEGLQRGRVRFFHDSNILNTHYYLSDENILHLNSGTDAALASYEHSRGYAEVLLVRYPDREKASLAYQDFLTHYLPDADAKGFALLENQRWSAVALKGELLTIILEAESRSLAEALLEAIVEKASNNLETPES